MPWTNPPTVVTNDVIPASYGNTYVRDNTRYLKGLDGPIAFDAAATFNGALTIAGALGGVTNLSMLGQLANGAFNASIELGQSGVANTPFIDFHSSASATDFDARILASGGTAVTGQGTLEFQASRLRMNGQVRANLGSAGAPAYTFDAHEGEGMYSSAPGRIDFAIGFAQELSLHATSLFPAGDNGLDLGGTNNRWSAAYVGNFLRLGGGNVADAGAIRLPNTAQIAWRKADNSGNVTMAVEAVDRLVLAGFRKATTVGAAGGASPLPATPAEYLEIALDGNLRKIPLYVA